MAGRRQATSGNGSIAPPLPNEAGMVKASWNIVNAQSVPGLSISWVLGLGERPISIRELPLGPKSCKRTQMIEWRHLFKLVLKSGK